MNLTMKHMVLIAVLLVAAYFGYTKYVVPTQDRTVKQLLEMYATGDSVETKLAESRLLGQCKKNPAAIPELLAGLTNRSSTKIRSLAAAGLGETRATTNKTVITALLKALKDQDDTVRAAAARAFAKVRVYEAIEPLMVMLDDPVAEVKRSAHVALKSITDLTTWPAHRHEWEDWWKEAKRTFYVKSDYYDRD